MNRPEWFPKIDFEGRVDLDSLRNLDIDRLASWITAVLRQEDSRLAGERDDRAYLYLGRLYRKLDGNTRGCFQDATQRLLAKLAAKVSPDPAAPPADDLLLLVAKVFSGPDPDLRNAPSHHLRKIADEEPECRPEGIHHRAVQTLVALRHGAPPRFWHRQFERGGDEYARVTFAGLSLIGLEEAFRWLTLNAGRSGALEALFSRLPLLLREEPRDRDRIRDLLHDLCHHLEQEEIIRLRKFTVTIGVALDPSPFVRWTDDELTHLTHSLDLGDLPLTGDRRNRETVLASNLRDTLPAELQSVEVPNSALTLLAVCRRLVEQRNAAEMAEELRLRIADAVDDLITETRQEINFVRELIFASMVVRDMGLSRRLNNYGAA